MVRRGFGVADKASHVENCKDRVLLECPTSFDIVSVPSRGTSWTNLVPKCCARRLSMLVPNYRGSFVSDPGR